MTASLEVRIDRPLVLEGLLQCAAARLMEMLRTEQNLTVGFWVPPGAPFSEAPPIIPTRPRWGLYFHLESVGESLVDSHLVHLAMESGPEPVVIHFEERRTPASKALAASLAVAAAEQLSQRILDYEHVWVDADEISAADLMRRFTLAQPEPRLDLALAAFTRRMNCPMLRAETI